jgi:hypothetical protein
MFDRVPAAPVQVTVHSIFLSSREFANGIGVGALKIIEK